MLRAAIVGLWRRLFLLFWIADEGGHLQDVAESGRGACAWFRRGVGPPPRRAREVDVLVGDRRRSRRMLG